MIDPIERQDAIDEVSRFIGYIDEDMINRIHIGLKRLPSAKRNGKWKILRVSKFSSAVNRVDARCSECNVFCSGTTQYKTMPYKFCPNCGADMRGEINETD